MITHDKRTLTHNNSNVVVFDLYFEIMQCMLRMFPSHIICLSSVDELKGDMLVNPETWNPAFCDLVRKILQLHLHFSFLSGIIRVFLRAMFAEQFIIQNVLF